jgi:type IV pilus assembly protein PilB
VSDRQSDPGSDRAKLLSKQYGVPFVNLDDYTVEPNVLARIPAEIAERHRLLPLRVDEQSPTLVIAMANPGDAEAIDDIQVRTGFTVDVVVASEAQLKRAINRYYFAN